MITKIVKKEFEEKCDDVIAVIKARISAFKLPVSISISRTDTMLRIKAVPNHPLGRLNSITYCAWIDNNEIRWSTL